MDNLTPDGKIKTIRCVKATHEDFAKLVQLGKDVIQSITQLEKDSGNTIESLEKELKKQEYSPIVFSDGTKHSILEIYITLIQKKAELDAYRNAYHVLMEEGVDELLTSINISAESYDYDFYELCLHF